jgi:gamma-glutamyltranspeptidase/glutathione hydrolase
MLAMSMSEILTSAAAAGLNMTEPCSTGIGGDMFILYWDAEKKQVHAMNGSGRSGGKCSLDKIRSELGLSGDGPGDIPMSSVHSVTVPGAPAGWVDTVERFGSKKVNLSEILKPAIEMGEKGYPVSEVTAFYVCFPASPSIDTLLTTTVDEI